MSAEPKSASTLHAGSFIPSSIDDLLQELHHRRQRDLIQSQERWRRLERIARRRPEYYLDFRSGNIRRGLTIIGKLPDTLWAGVLEHLFRYLSVDRDEFCLLPRSKQSTDRLGPRDLRLSLKTYVCRLRGFLRKLPLPIEVVSAGRQQVYKLERPSYLRANIDVANELAENGLLQLALGEIDTALSFSNQTLAIDPDNIQGTVLVNRMVGARFVTRNLYEPAIRAQNHMTRSILRLTRGEQRLRLADNGQGLYATVISKARRRLQRLLGHLSGIHLWHHDNRSSERDPYPYALELMVQAAMESHRGQSHRNEGAFAKLMAIPQIAQTIEDIAYTKSPQNHEHVAFEVQLRFWRLMLVDAWVPDVLDIDNYAKALSKSIRSRLRFSNTPDGQGWIPGIEFDEKLTVLDDEPGQESPAFE